MTPTPSAQNGLAQTVQKTVMESIVAARRAHTDDNLEALLEALDRANTVADLRAILEAVGKVFPEAFGEGVIQSTPWGFLVAVPKADQPVSPQLIRDALQKTWEKAMRDAIIEPSMGALREFYGEALEVIDLEASPKAVRKLCQQAIRDAIRESGSPRAVWQAVPKTVVEAGKEALGLALQESTFENASASDQDVIAEDFKRALFEDARVTFLQGFLGVVRTLFPEADLEAFREAVKAVLEADPEGVKAYIEELDMESLEDDDLISQVYLVTLMEALPELMNPLIWDIR